MKVTDCLALPYPECAPPLVKDASDIEQFRDLAEAVDAAVQAYADLQDETLINPPAVNMTTGSNQAGQTVNHFYSGLVFDNAGMADTVADVIRIQSDGWYLIGGWLIGQAGAPGVLTLRLEPLINGDPFSTRQGVGYPVNNGGDRVSWVDTQFLRAGDELTLRSYHTDNPAFVITYSGVGWALRILANV